MDVLGNFPDVPIFVDASVVGARFSMTRCSYLVIESSDSMPGWRLDLSGNSLPFLMLNLVGIVQGPFDAPRFLTAPVIDNFFATVENYRPPFNPEAEFTVEISDVWLPDLLFRRREVAVGDVFRVPFKLFNLCLAYREGTLEEERFLATCADFSGSLEFSMEETKAFAMWHELQVEEAREAFPKDPESELKRTDDLPGRDAGTL